MTLVALGASGVAHATTVAAGNASDDPAADRAVIVVTGQKAAADATHLDAKPLDLPIAISAVPIGVIADEGFVRLGDAVRNISGVVRKEAYFGLTDSFNIRGFDASTGLFNGFRQDYYGSIVDLAHVATVEVIKGPSSVTTGYLEPGGVVNVVTKRAGDTVTIWLETLHTAGVFGRALQIAIMLTGLGIASLSVTGVLIYLRKSAARRHYRARSRLAATDRAGRQSEI